MHLEKVEKQCDEFDRVQRLIELAPENDSKAAKTVQEENRVTFENQYCELVGLARDHIQNKTRSAIGARTLEQLAPTSDPSLHSPITITTNTGYSLPKMPLPTFDGSFDNWIKFRDSFQAIVHEREITNIDKFHYLNQALKGDAARVIQSLGISDANYEIAWKCLTDRYEDFNALTQSR